MACHCVDYAFAVPWEMEVRQIFVLGSTNWLLMLDWKFLLFPEQNILQRKSIASIISAAKNIGAFLDISPPRFKKEMIHRNSFFSNRDSLLYFPSLPMWRLCDRPVGLGNQYSSKSSRRLLTFEAGLEISKALFPEQKRGWLRISPENT